MADTVNAIPLGIMVNPRSGSMLVTGMFGGMVTSWGRVHRDVERERPNVGVLSLAKDELLASGYFDTGGYPLSYMATGYPRVHSNPGVISKDTHAYGVGAALYYGIAHASEMIRMQRVTPEGVEVDHTSGGISSTRMDSTRTEQADAWWDNAVFRHRVATRSMERVRISVDFNMPSSGSKKDIDARVKMAAAKALEIRLGSMDDNGDYKIDPSVVQSVFSNIKVERVDEDAKRAEVVVSNIEVDVLKYASVKKFVLASIIPTRKIDRAKRFTSIRDVPLDWLSVNKESMLAANVAELKAMGPFGKELMNAIVASLRKAKASDAEIGELYERYSRMVDAVIEPAAGAKFVMSSGTLRPSSCVVCVAKHNAAGAVSSVDRELANRLANRRIRLGWDAY